MNIHFRQGSETLSDKLVMQAETKIMKLARIIPERNYEAQVYVDVERESGANSSEKMWRTSLNLDLAGDRFNATEVSSTPEKAADLAIKELKREIRKANTKQLTAMRKGGGILKRLRRGFA